MLTPAQRHFQNVMAQRRGTAGDDGYEQTAYEQQLHRLRLDKSRLSQTQSVKTKAELKGQLLPNYQAWIDGVLQADTGQADDVVTTIMIWSIDAGDVAAALRIAEYVIRHKLPMPDQYQRTAATALVEEICDPVLVAFKANAGTAPLAADLLLQLAELTAGEDMPDQVRAKLYKTIGYTLRLDPNELPAAREWLQRAITLYSDIGVKRDIELLARAIKKAAIAAATAEDGAQAEPEGDTVSAAEEAASQDAAVQTAAKPVRRRTSGTAKAASKTAKTTKRTTRRASVSAAAQ